ncbi:DMT family transporter [Fulvimarina endophytica]|uniref:DMT family transporter n=1 Tax=Fulvimarina endophytica TaxID=2293836 RepID=A0A371X481_9HYPH|nr:DMT family transporter [Fulvimarina endophytica]RFC64035.1 DMT family transporter [Fulvimarina endophytica]
MQTAILFVSTVLIWGTTWIAIAAEVDAAPVIVSIFYRFALAGLVMVGGLALLGRLRRPALWRFVVLQALCLFSFNFIGLYNATATIPSGLVSVVFSLASIFNAVNARLIFGDRISPQTLVAGSFGVAGLTLVFWHDLAIGLDPATLSGLAFAVAGTMCFSLGNMASRKNSLLGITPVVANSWGMGIGAAVLLAIAAIRGEALVLPQSLGYWTALVYLAVIGSVVGFTTYLMLVARIGSARAGYATVLFPIVALTLSTLFEGYEWTATAVVGVFLVIVGNIVMFARR